MPRRRAVYSSSFLKKRTKKLPLLWAMGVAATKPMARYKKSFWGFAGGQPSSEKELLILL
jgi:hypothetical protein